MVKMLNLNRMFHLVRRQVPTRMGLEVAASEQNLRVWDPVESVMLLC